MTMTATPVSAAPAFTITPLLPPPLDMATFQRLYDAARQPFPHDYLVPIRTQSMRADEDREFGIEIEFVDAYEDDVRSWLRRNGLLRDDWGLRDDCTVSDHGENETCEDCDGRGSIYERVECEDCDGTGVVDPYACSSCDGRGTYTPYWDSTAQLTCHYCHGSGTRTVCRTCRGDGEVDDEGEECGTCDGEGSIYRGGTGGEIVTPRLEPTVENARTLARVLAMLSSEGADWDSEKPGAHISINGKDLDAPSCLSLGLFFRHFPDDLFRLATNVGRGYHRGTSYCSHSPNFDAHAILGMTDYRGSTNDGFHGIHHQFAQRGEINMCGVGPGNSRGGRIEFRLWDAEDQPWALWTRVLISTALVNAAAAWDWQAIDSLPKWPRGFHINRNERREALEGEAWERQTRSIRRLLPLLFVPEAEEEMIAVLRLWQSVPWQGCASEYGIRVRHKDAQFARAA